MDFYFIVVSFLLKRTFSLVEYEPRSTVLFIHFTSLTGNLRMCHPAAQNWLDLNHEALIMFFACCLGVELSCILYDTFSLSYASDGFIKKMHDASFILDIKPDLTLQKTRQVTIKFGLLNPRFMLL